MKALTLIEVMVVLAIVGTLFVVFIPSYHQYLVESRRADAVNTIRENQLIVEDYIQRNRITPTSGQVTLSTTSRGGYYTIAYTRVSDHRYRFVATAVGGTSQAGDTGCTVLTMVSEMDKMYPISCISN